jgi:MoaA/NifB/PqqE/SkfB family radical SAM enzyme
MNYISIINLLLEKYNSVCIVFSGESEPTYNKYIIDFLTYYKNNNNINFIIYTNGTNINLIKQDNVKYIVSWHHDNNFSYKYFLRNIKILNNR